MYGQHTLWATNMGACVGDTSVSKNVWERAMKKNYMQVKEIAGCPEFDWDRVKFSY